MKRQKVRKTLLLISMLVFPITLNYFSPYLIVQGSFEGILSGSGMLFLSMLLTSLILGRAFCGWLCPAGAIGEVCATIQDKPVGKRLRFMKYCIWVPWLSAIVFGFVHAGGLNNIDLVYYTDGGISVNATAGYIIYFSVIALVVVLALTVGRRSFCHGVCWMAPFMVIGTFMRDKLHLPGPAADGPGGSVYRLQSMQQGLSHELGRQRHGEQTRHAKFGMYPVRLLCGRVPQGRAQRTVCGGSAAACGGGGGCA